MGFSFFGGGYLMFRGFRRCRILSVGGGGRGWILGLGFEDFCRFRAEGLTLRV